MTLHLVLPAILIAALGWAVPRVLARFFPEGVKPLLLLAAVAVLLMWLIAAAGFAVLYALTPPTLPDGFAAVLYCLRLGLISALIWLPVLVLSVAGLPRRWTKATW
ncbi:hypothetical protein SAMN04488012_11555 [Palleronia salina]|uniref:Uncharacterized protein n=1 Tax=Palleronia salina TaxID=313368 RepID=A0A1M6LH22_9RHOB|nr:hypothetical protein [Palleronia salina]SHJ70490.1 hypothetical protein SAMN04488012_11555 [Palleronia salina]